MSTSDTGRSRACCQDVMRSAASPAITPTAGPRVTRSRSVGVGGARRRRPSHPPHRLPTWPRRREGQPEPLCRMLISTRVRVASSRCSTVSSTTGKPTSRLYSRSRSRNWPLDPPLRFTNNGQHLAGMEAAQPHLASLRPAARRVRGWDAHDLAAAKPVENRRDLAGRQLVVVRPERQRRRTLAGQVVTERAQLALRLVDVGCPAPTPRRPGCRRGAGAWVDLLCAAWRSFLSV